MIHRPRSVLAVFAISLLACLAVPAGALAFEPLSSFGFFGEGAGQLNSAGIPTIAPDGTTYVPDEGNNRIDVFNPQGGFLYAFGKEVNATDHSDVCNAMSGCKQGASNGSAGGMNIPKAIAIGPEGNLFVSDEDNRIDVFNPQGGFVRAFGKEVNASDHTDVCTGAENSICQRGVPSSLAGGLFIPGGIDFDSAGKLLIADDGNNRIDVFDPQGHFLYAFGKEVNADHTDVCRAGSQCQEGGHGVAGGEMHAPFDVTVAPSGQLVVAELLSERIDVFGPDGAFVRTFGKGVNASDNSDVCAAGSRCREGQFDPAAGGLGSPVAVAVSANSEIYVADRDFSRIDQFSIEGRFLRAFGGGVDNGGEAFEVCTTQSGCQGGSNTAAPGAIPRPLGVALDCRGAVYATAGIVGSLSRVMRFGEPGTPPPPCPPPPSNKFKFLKLVLNKRRGTATLVVQVPGPGGLLLKGKGLKTVKRPAKAAGKVKLPVKPVGGSKRKLARAGVLKLRAKVTFTPTGGTAATKAKVLRLKRLLR